MPQNAHSPTLPRAVQGADVVKIEPAIDAPIAEGVVVQTETPSHPDPLPQAGEGGTRAKRGRVRGR